VGAGRTEVAGRRGHLKAGPPSSVAPRIFGILNLSPESFSDGGKYCEPASGVEHAARLRTQGADVIDVGAAASNIDATAIPAEEEIARLEAVLTELLGKGVIVSVDSASPTVQRYALDRGVHYLNDVGGFADETIHARLATSSAKLIVVHTLTGPRAFSRDTRPGEVAASLWPFFDRRIEALSKAGVSTERMILDPGMGLFLGRGAEPSIEALRSVSALRRRYGLPVLVSVSRKSFLGDITGRPIAERGAATLAAELYAVQAGADYVRTHDPGALRDALEVGRALRG
jgi:dihydropteroate synthase type 2